MRWVEICIDATEAAADAVANVLIEEGCGGAVFGSVPGAASARENRVAGYLPVDDRLEARLTNIRDRISALPSYGLPLVSDEVTITWIQDEEWATAWKKHFKPVRIGRIVVKPTWEEIDPQPDDVIIDIDPGMAFGTGYHPTTQLCLQALQERVKGGEVALDVGTGSGVLAIAAAKLGAKRVVGLDVDTVAVEVAQENVDQSGLTETITIDRADSPLALEGQADIVTANILAQVLIDMAGQLYEKLKPGAILIGSGIIAERGADVKAAFEAIGLRIIEEKRDGDWVALVCERIE